MKYTIEQIHLASQYLAAAGISFLEKNEDDSHTNLGWNSVNKRLTTHPFGKNQVGINIATGTLEWLIDEKVSQSIDLQHSTHTEIVNWFNDAVRRYEIGKDYKYAFHYALPYETITSNNTFTFNSAEALSYAQHLSKAQSSFEVFISENGLESPIRVWPHHFDLGVYVALDGSRDLFMSAGLAIADTMVDELYFYSSGWKKNEEIKSRTFIGLEKGEWRTDWDGAVLRSSEANEKDAIHFLNETKIKFTEN